MSSFTSRHTPILVFVAIVFALRSFIAPTNSYWLDEILSIWIYGANNPSMFQAIERLAENSIHPPLYQSLLYFWMVVFGHSELATRTLSNLFVSLATIALYALLGQIWSRPLAALGSALFSFSYPVMYYGVEARSYALTILLSVLSSYFFLKAFLGFRRHQSNSHLTILFWGSATNAALLLTHYYNLFWVAAQTIFLLLLAFFVLGTQRVTRIFGLLFFAGVLPILIFIATWGQVFRDQFLTRSVDYAVEDEPSKSAVDMIWEFSIAQNLKLINLPPLESLSLSSPWAENWIFSVVFILALSAAVWGLLSASRSPGERVVLGYLIFWLVGPTLLTWLAFSMFDVERYSARYFLHSIAPFFPLTLALIVAGSRLWPKSLTSLVGALLAGTLTCFLAGAAILGGFEAATQKKHDWRGITQTVLDSTAPLGLTDFQIVVISNSASGERENYYFQRLSRNVRLDLALPRSQARLGNFSPLEPLIQSSESGSKLYVLFLHNRASAYPDLIDHLDSRLEVQHSQLNRMARGFIVYGPQAGG